MFNLIRRCEKRLPDEYQRRPAWLGFPTASLWLQLERARLYYKTGRWLKPSEKLELKRMPKLKRVQANPLLTNQYLYGEPAPKPGSSKRWAKGCAVKLKEVVRGRHEPARGISRIAWEAKEREWKLNLRKTEWPEIQGKPFAVNWKSKKQVLREALELSGGVIQVCPPEKTTAQLLKRKVGRPPIGECAMTDAEYKRRSRAKQKAKTLPPQERNEPGAVAPLPLGPTVPGVNFIVERNNMFLEKMARQHQEFLDRLSKLLDRLESAQPDYVVKWDELEILADAAAYDRKVH
jgi:hypothetical protein